jgi:hypothetical protein
MLLQLLALLAGLALAKKGVTTPATPFQGIHSPSNALAFEESFPFQGIANPSKQCLDIFCYSPLQWHDNQEEVCRFKKEKTCRKRSKEICIDVPVTTCELVGFTECTTNEDPQPLRDDKVIRHYYCRFSVITEWQF